MFLGKTHYSHRASLHPGVCQWHAHDNDCEGGSSSGNSTESSIREGSGDIQGGNLEATSSLNRGKKFYNNK